MSAATGATGATGPTGATGATGAPDTLVTTNSTPQTLAADASVAFAANSQLRGTSISHTEGSTDIILSEDGLYVAYYTGLVTGSAAASYPLAVTVALYQNGVRLPESASTVTLTSAGQQERINGDTAIRVSNGAATNPSTITVRNETSGVTWNYAEILVGKSF